MNKGIFKKENRVEEEIMVHYLINIIVGLIEVMMLLIFSASYGLVCVVFGWTPDLSLQTWAYITIALSSAILIISLSLWRFTRFKEGIHAWILIPELFLGKLWITSLDEVSFQGIAMGSMYLGMVFIVLVCLEMGRSWYIERK
jgi:hypothetical protein